MCVKVGFTHLLSSQPVYIHRQLVISHFPQKSSHRTPLGAGVNLQVLLVGDRAVLIAELREELRPSTANATCLVALAHYGALSSLLQWTSLVLPSVQIIGECREKLLLFSRELTLKAAVFQTNNEIGLEMEDARADF